MKNKPNKKLSTKFKKMFDKHLSELNKSNKEIDGIIDDLLSKMQSDRLTPEEYKNIFGSINNNQNSNKEFTKDILKLRNNMDRIDELFKGMG